MAKIAFSKLQASVNNSDCKNSYCNRAGEEIFYEVKYYLPIQEKIDLISRIVNQSIDGNGFYNPLRVKIFMVLEVIYAYTNFTFTEKMKDDPLKLYDILVSTGIFEDVIKSIRDKDWQEIQDNTWSVIKNIYDYRNSAVGLLETISADYSNLNLDASEIQEKLSDPDNLTLLKDVITKLG